MRLDPRPTVPEVLPAFRSYRGEALRPLTSSHLTAERIADCATAALERGDREGVRLARILLGMSRAQRQQLRKGLTATLFAS
jgi:hypothetical protein